MALDKTKLSLLMPCGTGGDVWMYQTADAKAVVVGANYFLPVANQLNTNDRMHVWSGIGGSVDYFDLAILVATPVTVTSVASASMT